MADSKTAFCSECRTKVEYEVKKIPCKKCIKEKEFTFEIINAQCPLCGESINVPGLMDYNVQEIDRQYRLQEDIITIDDIYKLMNIYEIGKAPLSLALGFGEITITRYLSGQIPSKEYSDIMKKALESPAFMKEKLDEHADKIGSVAYKKSMKAIHNLNSLFKVSDKMLLTISYIFEKAVEVTPLALQKMLYFIQAMHLVIYERPFYREDCEAWAHGPVYKNVYAMFKDFKYNPIEDSRFAILQYRFQDLKKEEKEIIDLVLDTFGIYSGKTLELITHNEDPWKEARINSIPSSLNNAVITKDKIKTYFKIVSKKYDFKTREGIKSYIENQIN